MDSPEPDGRWRSTYPPPALPRPPGRTQTIVGLVLAAVGILFFPAGIAAIVFGILAARKGDPWARWVIGAGVLGSVVGLILLGNLPTDDDALGLLA